MEDLLRLVAARSVPAPAPIEQRWTAGSSAAMSPAHGPPGSLHSWVGVIMYLAELAPEQRQAVTDRCAGGADYCGHPQRSELHAGRMVCAPRLRRGDR